MFHRMAKRRCRVEGGKHARTRRFDVGLEPFNLLLGGCVCGLCLGERRRRRVAGMVGLVSGPVSFSQRKARRLTAGLELPKLCRYFLSARRQHLDVMPVELLLLLTTIDVELSGVSILANPRRTVSASACSSRRRACSDSTSATRADAAASCAGVGESRVRGVNRLSQLTIASHQEHLFPTQLLPKPLVSTRLCGLPLERPALLFDLEHDVVNAGEVLLRRFQLQPAARRRAVLVIPAASSMSWRRSAGRELRIMPIFPCSMMAYAFAPSPVSISSSWTSRSRHTSPSIKYSLSPER